MVNQEGDNSNRAEQTEGHTAEDTHDVTPDMDIKQKEFAVVDKKTEEPEEDAVPLWLITFTDVMALMLTFFVLLYSMSVPQQEKWEEMTAALSTKLNKFAGKEFFSGTQDAISIDRIDTSRALDLGYIRTLITGMLEEREITDVVLVENGGRLVLSLPSELLFESGSATIGLEGKKVLFALGGALSRIKNRIEIVGHTDPRPISGGQYSTNWQLSLARATSVASMLREVGYARDMTVRGLASARFDELPEEMSEDKRFSLSRRVDIIIMDDAGYRQNAFDVR